jgi:hypothetical protein
MNSASLDLSAVPLSAGLLDGADSPVLTVKQA